MFSVLPLSFGPPPWCSSCRRLRNTQLLWQGISGRPVLVRNLFDSFKSSFSSHFLLFKPLFSSFFFTSSHTNRPFSLLCGQCCHSRRTVRGLTSKIFAISLKSDGKRALLEHLPSKVATISSLSLLLSSFCFFFTAPGGAVGSSMVTSCVERNGWEKWEFFCRS